ncbi:MAG: hypothetical protein EYC69_02190 [Bacteroidetes bacterium]|nr:MAG: hypothetical protein EYC69_02190 [Bacteroidota bacterium]
MEEILEILIDRKDYTSIFYRTNGEIAINFIFDPLPIVTFVFNDDNEVPTPNRIEVITNDRIYKITDSFKNEMAELMMRLDPIKVRETLSISIKRNLEAHNKAMQKFISDNKGNWDINR